MTSEAGPRATPAAEPHLAAIESMAREAGALLRSRFGNPGVVQAKGVAIGSDRVYDVVTELDFACERLVLDRVRELNPDAVVLGEEGGAVLVDGTPCPTDLAEVEDLWIVDPLDGTVNYAQSLPLFCVSLARYSRGAPVAGSIYDPMLDEMFSFDADGSTLNGAPIQVAQRENSVEAMLAVGSTGGPFREIAKEFRSWRRIGSAALSMAWVACGRFDAYVQLGNLAPWDLAVGAPLIERAGGMITTHGFEAWPYPLEGWSGAIAASTPIHGELSRIMRSC